LLEKFLRKFLHNFYKDKTTTERHAFSQALQLRRIARERGTVSITLIHVRAMLSPNDEYITDRIVT